MPIRRPPRTWLEVAVINAGLRDATRAISWAFTWGVTRAALGHDPTVDEVAEWWNEPVRTAYREQASFRASFPKLDNPALIMDNDQARTAIERFVSAAKEFEELKRQKHARVDKAVLAVGMLAATEG